MSHTRLFLAWVFLFSVAASTTCGRRAEEPPESSSVGPRPIAVDPSTVAEIRGVVRLEGAPPKRAVIQMDEDPVCVEEHKGQAVDAIDGAVNPDGTLPNVFVYVKKGAEPYAFPMPSQLVILDQAGCMYEPHVLGIMTRQTLRILSHDPTTHNIHAMARINPQWNLSQLPGAPPIEKSFSQPEIMIPVKCNQHPWMRCYIGVMSNPLFAVTGANGNFRLTGLPPGAYTIGAWTATFGTAQQEVTVGPRETKSIEFTFRNQD